MKVCPKCARSFADGFTYCPNDAAGLVKYDLRAHLHSKPELQFLLKNDTLLYRLKRELSSAIKEFNRNPRRYLKSLFRGEGSSRRRRMLLHTGAATGFFSYAAIVLILTLLGLPLTRRTTTATPEDPRIRDGYRFIIPVAKPTETMDQNNSRGRIGGEAATPRRAKGGGGGGDKAPARAGVQPTASLTQQLRSPSPELPKIPNAKLITPETVFADPKSFLDLKGPTGLIGGRPAAPSMGEGPGTGVGPGKGPGYGPGEDGGTGGRKFALGGGRTTGDGDDNGVYNWTRSLQPTILYKEKAAYTEEARQNGIQGVVVLNVTFGADNRLRDIRVIRGLPAGLTEKAIEAAGRIRFNPALRNGKPVNVRGTIEFNFNLY